MKNRRFLASVLFVLTPCMAQTNARMAFDVSSVKPAQGKVSQGSIRRLGVGIVSVTDMTVSDMIELFYHVKAYQVKSGPDWMRRERFDVTGKDSNVSATGQKPTPEAMDADDDQMQELLKERFGLRLHHEHRTLQTLTLVTDTKKSLPAVPCSSEYRLQHGFVKGAIHMASLASLLKADLGMPVRDGTGLENCYYINTRWTTDTADESLPSIPTALHDLGLRLEKSMGDVDVLVVDHLDRPQPD